MEKVREHLASLGSVISDPKTVPVVVKAYANLSGLAHACVRDKKLGSVSEMTQFWIGFTRRCPLIDFVDVGSGKEEADSKIRGASKLLSHYHGFTMLTSMPIRSFVFPFWKPSMRAHLARLLPRCGLRTCTQAVCYAAFPG